MPVPQINCQLDPACSNSSKKNKLPLYSCKFRQDLFAHIHAEVFPGFRPEAGPSIGLQPSNGLTKFQPNARSWARPAKVARPGKERRKHRGREEQIHIDTHIHVFTSTCTCPYIHVFVYIYMIYMCIYIYIYIHTYLNLYARMYVCMHACIMCVNWKYETINILYIDFYAYGHKQRTWRAKNVHTALLNVL